jgi:hypothetical protein
MPGYRFTWPTALTYPENRDAAGFPLGLVNPGDVRDLDEAPDHLWLPLSDEEEQQRLAGLAAAETATPAGAGAGEPDDSPGGGDPGTPPPAAPQPAPPAAVPTP